MERFGIFSRNIVLHNQDLPMCGVILVNGELIEEVIFNLPKEATYDSVASRFMGTHILDYSDLYVCPGIIDLNVKCNEGWDGRTFASMAAISGGVTFFLEEE
jgi:dihydroorotase-like cyclic amidohydrolase